jgi:hypothetical protein
MTSTRERAIEAISNDPEFAADYAVMLRLGHLAKVDRWFYVAFKEIISSPVSALTMYQCETLGTDLLHKIIRSRKMIEVSRILIVLHGPKFERSQRCQSRFRRLNCEQGWRCFWDECVVPRLLGDGDISSQRFMAHAESNPVGICRPCHQDNILQLCAGRTLDTGTYVAERESRKICQQLVGSSIADLSDDEDAGISGDYGGEGEEQ